MKKISKCIFTLVLVFVHLGLFDQTENYKYSYQWFFSGRPKTNSLLEFADELEEETVIASNNSL